MTSTIDTSLCPSFLMSGAMSRNRITSGPVEVGVYRLWSPIEAVTPQGWGDSMAWMGTFSTTQILKRCNEILDLPSPETLTNARGCPVQWTVSTFDKSFRALWRSQQHQSLPLNVSKNWKSLFVFLCHHIFFRHTSNISTNTVWWNYIFVQQTSKI